jgi:hypothetical protein
LLNRLLPVGPTTAASTPPVETRVVSKP